MTDIIDFFDALYNVCLLFFMGLPYQMITLAVAIMFSSILSILIHNFQVRDWRRNLLIILFLLLWIAFTIYRVLSLERFYDSLQLLFEENWIYYILEIGLGIIITIMIILGLASAKLLNSGLIITWIVFFLLLAIAPYIFPPYQWSLWTIANIIILIVFFLTPKALQRM